MIVAEQAQPDVIVVGSNFADMYLKTCETSKAEHRRYREYFQQNSICHLIVIKSTSTVSPLEIKVTL